MLTGEAANRFNEMRRSGAFRDDKDYRPALESLQVIMARTQEQEETAK